MPDTKQSDHTGVRISKDGAGLAVLPGPQLANILALAVILLTAAFFRLAFVQQPLTDAFSWREVSTAMMAENFRHDGWNILYPEVSWTGPAPSYQGREFQVLSYTSALIDALFGWHDWTGRAVATFFGVVTTFALHRLTGRIWEEPHAHCAALCYAILPAAVMIDTSYLPDPAMLALVTLGVWLFVVFASTLNHVTLICATASLTLGVLAKVPGLSIAIVIMPVWLVLYRSGNRTKARLAALWLSGGLILVAAYYAWAFYLGRTTPPFHVAGHGYVWELGIGTFLHDWFYLPLLWRKAVAWFYGVPYLILIGLGLWSLPNAQTFRRYSRGSPALVHLPLIWLGSGLLLYLIAAREISANLWNLHYLSAPLAIFAGRGMIVALRSGGTVMLSWLGLARLATLLAAVLLFSTLPLLKAMKHPYSETGRRLGTALATRIGPEDLVVAVAPTVGDPVAIFYAHRRGWVFPPGGGAYDWSVLLPDGPDAINALNSLRNQGADWFAVSKDARDRLGQGFMTHHAKLLAWLDETATKAADTPEYVIYRLAK